MPMFTGFIQQLRQTIMPQRRSLTEGEQQLAKSVFASALDTTHIEIVAHHFILPKYAMSPNGSIYFNPQDYVDDFSQQDMISQSWLIHELAHVWQLQQGIAVVRRAIFDRRYRYAIELGKQFSQYGVEQQAQMIQDYFIRKQRGLDCGLYEQCIPFLQTSKKQPKA